MTKYALTYAMDDVNPKYLNQWVSELVRRREALGWSRYRLARLVGLTPATLAHIEKRKTKTPHRLTIAGIERALAEGEAE